MIAQEQSKFIVEALGGCWHEWVVKPNSHPRECIKCSMRLFDPPPNPDLSTWPGFGWAWERMMEKTWSGSFIRFLRKKSLSQEIVPGMLSVPALFIEPERFANALYEFLKGRTP